MEQFALHCLLRGVCNASPAGAAALCARCASRLSPASKDGIRLRHAYGLRPTYGHSAVPIISLPPAFRQLGENELIDSVGILKPFWEKMRMLRLGASADTIRIVHVGDSHIRGHIFPQTTGELLRKTFGALTYTDMGINGAFCVTFTRPVRVADIAALHPDLVILSFGTNESHNRRYNSKLHYQQMDDWYVCCATACPASRC